MNRLIDKMDTITAINDYYDMAKYKGAQFTEKQLLNVIIGIITSQPTAYDVEAVVSELNERMNYYLDLWSDCKDKDDPETAEMWVLKARAIHEDIEIVKAGGRNE